MLYLYYIRWEWKNPGLTSYFRDWNPKFKTPHSLKKKILYQKISKPNKPNNNNSIFYPYPDTMFPLSNFPLLFSFHSLKWIDCLHWLKKKVRLSEKSWKTQGTLAFPVGLTKAVHVRFPADLHSHMHEKKNAKISRENVHRKSIVPCIYLLCQTQWYTLYLATLLDLSHREKEYNTHRAEAILWLFDRCVSNPFLPLFSSYCHLFQRVGKIIEKMIFSKFWEF